VGQQRSAADLANAILDVIERGGRHAWVEVVELCATAKRDAAAAEGSVQRAATRRRKLVP
jgi:hypothetical protein